MLKFRIKYPIIKALDELRKKSSDLTPAMQSIAAVMKTRTLLSFSQGRSPYGESWPPLKLRSGQPLRDTGTHLMGRMQTFSSDRRAVVGVNTMVSWKGKRHALGAIHQFGATVVPRPDNPSKLLKWRSGGQFFVAKKTVIPARPFLPTEGFPPDYQRQILAEIVHHLSKAQ